jgi:nucleotide-binding universal stress UspA family protein
MVETHKLLQESNTMFTKILVPVDGSRYATHAVETAGDVVGRYHASVHLLHVIRDMSLPQEIMDMIAAGEVTASRREILEDSAEIILENARARLDSAGISDIQSEYVTGDPATEIAGYAARNGVDLIVIGHRGLGPEGGLLGSVTRKLLNESEVACLVIT